VKNKVEPRKLAANNLNIKGKFLENFPNRRMEKNTLTMEDAATRYRNAENSNSTYDEA